jgi:GNAT superfamily N-acetyltransferase
MNVALEVPDHVDFQLVYRMERERPYQVALDAEFEFVFLDSPLAASRLLRVLRPVMGGLHTAKALPRLCTGIRHLYLIMHRGAVASFGWGTVGLCKHYKVERDAVIIGPIWSDPRLRGGGLATAALQAAINEYLRRGKSVFYIDTSKTNIAAQRVFEKSGFGEPVALYFR